MKRIKKFFSLFKSFFGKLGPGFITGAADDDPSGIATYSIAGAQFGYKLSWLSFWLIPMMISVQEMCGRIGIVTGMGLTGVIKKYYSKKLLFFTVSLLFIANTINIGADLGIMAACLKMIMGMSFYFWLLIVVVITVSMEIFLSYKSYFNYLKWMSLSLLVYMITALIVKQDWRSIAYYTLIPHVEFNLTFLITMVGFLGTTISPYLFFWQTSQEVEEEIKKGKIGDFCEKVHFCKKEIKYMRKDTSVGMIFSELITFFIILTTTATLHNNGIFNIETPQQAALAIRPLAGNFAYLLFTIGILGIGLQSIPILAGGVAYVFAEAFGFKEGLSKKFFEAKAFYGIICLATLVGVVFNLIGVNPIKYLYYAAVINGIIAVPLIPIIIKLADNPQIVGKNRTPRSLRLIGWLTFCLMGMAVILMLWNLFTPRTS